MGGLLLGSNVLWFGMLRAIRKGGYPVSVINSLRDLRSYRALIQRSDEPASRLRLIAALATLYLLLTALMLTLLL